LTTSSASFLSPRLVPGELGLGWITCRCKGGELGGQP